MSRAVTSAVMLSLVLALTAGAQLRGRSRIHGVVTDKETGKPIAGAAVTVAFADGSTEPIVATTDKRGRWSALGLVGGTWNVDIEKSGYTTSRGTANVSEMQMLPSIKSELVPEVQEEVVVGPVTGGPPPAAVAAVRAGEDLMKAKQYGDAAAEFEKALALLADNVQIKQALAQAYYGAGELKKAITMLETVVAADPSNHGAALLLVNLYLEDSRLTEGKALLEKLPPDAITDPLIFINLGILFMNQNSLQDAAVHFGKAVELDPNRGESYYYRGLAHLQTKKVAEAKADFEKVIALAPESTEADDAAQLLAAMR